MSLVKSATIALFCFNSTPSVVWHIAWHIMKYKGGKPTHSNSCDFNTCQNTSERERYKESVCVCILAESVEGGQRKRENIIDHLSKPKKLIK